MSTTLAQKLEIDRRLAAHRADPQTAIPWEQVEAAALKRLAKFVSRSRSAELRLGTKTPLR